MKLKEAAKLAGFDHRLVDPAMLIGMFASAEKWIKFSQQNPEKNTFPAAWAKAGQDILDGSPK